LEAANVRQDGIDEDFWLVSVPLTIRWDNSDSPLDPRRGQRLEAHLTPVPRTQGGSDAFLRAWLLATAYLELPRQRENNIELESRTPAMGRRRVLAARLALGRILGATSGAVPPNWRFYAGGGGSVRGFPFQSIGPETADGSPAGGDALVEASVELRQGLGARWEVAAFVDSGAVSEDGFEELRDLAVALGLGVRYHTPVGPIRADLAAPVTQTQDHPSVQLYIGIGQAF
jgi:translocation and assembly module TamA